MRATFIIGGLKFHNFLLKFKRRKNNEKIKIIKHLIIIIIKKYLNEIIKLY